MPLSGVFFVSLHHQSNRMTMFKKTNPNPQLDIFTAPSMQLGSRASKKCSDPNSWHNQFYSLVTTKIDEEIFFLTANYPEPIEGTYQIFGHTMLEVPVITCTFACLDTQNVYAIDPHLNINIIK